MQNHDEDAFFDNNKYHFPPGTLVPPKKSGPQPWLEVAPERDEQGSAPGLQPIPHDEQKYADAPRGLHDAAPPYRTTGAAHADELAFQGMQAVPPTVPEQLTRSQPHFQSLEQPQLQPQWHQSTPNHYYGQSFQTLPSQVSGFSGDNPMYAQPIASNTESQYLNPYAQPNPTPSWVKAERQIGMGEVKIKQWVLWVIGGVVFIFIGAGAVIGGIMGSRAESANHSSSSTPPSTNTTTNGTSPNTMNSTLTQSIRSGSRLAVTGYRTKTDYSIRLFYQDEDHQLRFTDKENVNANWTNSTILDSLPYQPMKDYGAIAAGSYLYDDPAPKIEFFYEDQDGIIRGQNFNFDFEGGKIPAKGEAGSINSYPLQSAGGTISCYFPYVISQDANNEVRWTVMHGQNSSNLSAPWWVNNTNWDIKASKGAGMVVLPIAQKFQNAGGIIYRSSEGMLSMQIHDALDPSNDGVAWRKGALSKAIPANASVGAFSVGRPYDNNNQINTYILYQDNDGKIQVVWQDDDSGWKGPQTYDALSGAAQPTDIACLTPGAYDAAGIGISREQDMNRCFFQVSGGKVKEVWFDGTNWNDVGFVPT
ncbi:uncharacterized protein F4822DRAFT_224534 [Hypoxylon trugodes]|uniref:uncharacterized protein n=1 Tax=Hypoxylon trugodes TaxID=326681 RepID=UPI0021947E0D|nr:uncharacterized protein F4822DRAFT_224534 [Hypoxylon trugodes]KAI1390104.1 hypothetical protein F4822DRAFT_224534 [Hypoxylon trugodes]